ncbi:MAG: nuclease-related domain-containing protein, partial [Halobacteriota archaeon]
MKVLKHAGDYLEKKARLNRNRSISLIIVGFAGFPYAFLSASFLLFIPSFIVLMIGVSFLDNYSNYKRGIEGENVVVKSLSALDDSYYLINDVKFPKSYGNIDHVVLGPNGIFVIE